MSQRGRLNHTALENTLGMLFAPDRLQNTSAIISGTAEPTEFVDTRRRICMQATVLKDVQENLEAISRDLDLYALVWPRFDMRLSEQTIKWLRGLTGNYTFAWLGIGKWKHSVEGALAAYVEGFQAVAEKRAIVGQLATLHGSLVTAHKGRRFFDIGT